ncbi:MAG: hypothetical protein ABW190_13890, partial [Rhizobacter sp.]
MTDLLAYIYNEVYQKRLPRQQAIELIREINDRQPDAGSTSVSHPVPSAEVPHPSVAQVQTVLMESQWQAQEATPTPSWQERHVLLIGPSELSLQGAQVHHLPSEGDVAERYTRSAEQLLELVQSILRSKPQQPVLVQLVV